MGNIHQDIAIGVDVGGTNVKIGMVDREGTLLDFITYPTVRDDSGTVSTSRLADAVTELVEKYRSTNRVVGVGLSTPGILDTNKGIVHYAINLGWEKLPLADILEEKAKLSVKIVSDVTAGALGEYHFGSAKNHASFLYISVGTGIGASYLSKGAFFQTANGSTLNIGHTSIEFDGPACECGNAGCLEQYVSGSAITSRMKVQYPNESAEFLDDYGRIGVLEIYHSAQRGHAYSQKILSEAGEMLGVAIVNMVNLFGAGLVVIGGGVSQAESYFIESARRTVSERLTPLYMKELNIVRALFPQHAGILGAAVAAFHHFDQIH